jgi:hypothetical protein
MTTGLLPLPMGFAAIHLSLSEIQDYSHPPMGFAAIHLSLSEIWVRDTGLPPPTHGVCCYPPIFRYRITPTHLWDLLFQRYGINPSLPWDLLLSTYLYQRYRIIPTHLRDCFIRDIGLIPPLPWELLSSTKVSRGRERWIRCMCIV